MFPLGTLTTRVRSNACNHEISRMCNTGVLQACRIGVVKQLEAHLGTYTPRL